MENAEVRISGYRKLPQPDAMLRDIFAVTPEWMAARGLRALILDVDNTLAGYMNRTPDRKVCGHLRELARQGVLVSIVSNAAQPRVRRFAEALFPAPDKMPYIARSGKPRPDALLAMAKQLGVTARETAMVGDQLLTDIAAGRRAGMYTVWVEPFRNPFLFHVFFRARRRMEARMAKIGKS